MLGAMTVSSLHRSAIRRQAQAVIPVRTAGRGFTDLTADLAAIVRESGIGTGLATLFVRHTSASLVIQENADPDVLADLEDAFSGLAPEDPRRYRHGLEGPDDMPAHIRSALTQTSLGVPVADGRPLLGTWQAVYLFEHRAAPHDRQVVVHLLGD